MEVILEFLGSWWGVIGILILFGIELYFEREVAVKRIRDLIFLAEEKGRKGVLKTGEEKFEWVLENGYGYLPPVMKQFISKALFATFVQSVFDRIMEWAQSKSLDE